jgi:hypothetical protein
MKIEISIPRRYFSLTLGVSKYRRLIPEAWSDIHGGKRRLFFLRCLSILPHDEAMLHIIRSILKLNKRRFLQLDPADVAAISDQLDWMRLEPSTIPIISTFHHHRTQFAFPRPEFVGGTAYEFALADSYYSEWAENPDDPKPLLRLVATLIRPLSTFQLAQTGDARIPLSSDPQKAEHAVEEWAKRFDDLDFAYTVAALRYFEGVKKEVHEIGINSGIFEKPKEDDDQSPVTNNQSPLFGWWTAFRSVAKSQQKTEEQIWQMSLWRVLSIMIEEKHKADEMERQMNNNSSKD